MAGSVTQSVGEYAETRALAHLEARGLDLISRNFRCRIGEIDLVMRDAGCLVFVEVRYRKAGQLGRLASAAESVDRRKQKKLLAAASVFIARHRQFRNFTVRFDVVALDGRSRDKIRLQWLRDAFRPGE
jgi:putative endonuclease